MFVAVTNRLIRKFKTITNVWLNTDSLSYENHRPAVEPICENFNIFR